MGIVCFGNDNHNGDIVVIIFSFLKVLTEMFFQSVKIHENGVIVSATRSRNVTLIMHDENTVMHAIKHNG